MAASSCASFHEIPTFAGPVAAIRPRLRQQAMTVIRVDRSLYCGFAHVRLWTGKFQHLHSMVAQKSVCGILATYNLRFYKSQSKKGICNA
jgi:hypothetical protein